MARAKSTAQLAAEKLKAGNDYRAMVVFASRSLELQPRSRRLATLLLGLIPRDDAQQTVWMTLGDSLCGTEPLSDMRSLGRLGGNLPRDLAEAVLVVPGRLPDYVAYSVTSVQDPHSDYALQMQRVCGAEHSAFVRAVDGLEPESKDRFLKHVFDPRRCHALALPESE
jgi:hypothetical protein